MTCLTEFVPFSVPQSVAAPLSRPGCRWDARDYSCAYDSTLVPLFHILASMDGAQRAHFAQSGAMQHRVLELFANVPANPDCVALEQGFRDPLRRILHASDADEFPAGRVFASAERVVRTIIDAEPPLCQTVTTCQICQYSSTHSNPYHLPSMLDVTAIDAYHRARRTSPIKLSKTSRSLPLSEWAAAGAVTPFDPLHAWNPICPNCHAQGPFQLSCIALTTPPLIALDVTNHEVRPELLFTMRAPLQQPDRVYRLSAVVYYGGGHFTCRYIDSAGVSWAHDGQIDGMMRREGPTTSVDLSVLDTRRATILYFVLVL